MLSKLLPLAGLVLIAGASFRSQGMALFTDDEDVINNVFTAGTIDLALNNYNALISFSAMVPGDSVTSSLVVSNSGTIQFRYAMTASATNADLKNLKDELNLVIKTLGTNCATFDGVQLYNGDLDGAAGVIFGSTAQGAQAGDRTLNASASETLCLKVSLPVTAANSFQGATTTATFTFTAEQTGNNP